MSATLPRRLALFALVVVPIATAARLPTTWGYFREALPALLAWHEPATQRRLVYAGEAYDFLRAADLLVAPHAALLLVTPGADVHKLETTVLHRALYELTPRAILWAAPAARGAAWETRLLHPVDLVPEALGAAAAGVDARCLLAWQVELPPGTGTRLRRFAGGALWSLPGVPPSDCLRGAGPPPPAPAVRGAWGVRLAGALATLLLAGGALVAAAARRGAPGCRGAEGLARAWLFGAGAISTGMALLCALRVPLPTQIVLLSCGSLLAALDALRRRSWTPRPPRAAEPEGATTPSRLVARFAVAGTATLLALTAVFVFAIAVGRPLWIWDSWATWGSKARTIFLEGGIGSAVFADPTRASMLPAYPLQVPLVQAFLYAAVGSADDRLAGLVAALGWLALAAQLHGAARRWGGSEPLAFAVAATGAAVPFVAGTAAYAFADVPLAALFALLAIVWVDRGRGDARAAPGLDLLALLAAAWLPWTKREGWVLLASACAAAWWLGGVALRRSAARALGAGALVGGAWLLFLARFGSGPGVGDFGLASAPHGAGPLARLPTILRLELGQLLDPGWAWLWPLAALSATVAIWRRLRTGPPSDAAGATLLGVVVALDLALLTGAYTLSTYVPLQQHVLTSFYRLAVQVAPLVALAWALEATGRRAEAERHDLAHGAMSQGAPAPRSGAASGPGLSLVLPARDEAANLPGMLEEIDSAFSTRVARLEIVVVDDGSTDATPELLAAAVARDPRIRAVCHATPLGCGAAVRSGLAAAREELVLLTDADRQFELEDAHALIDSIANADLAIGYRIGRRDGLWREVLGSTWSATVNLLFGQTARDVDCAMKLARRETLAAVLPRLTSRGAAISAEWLVAARRSGQRIVELPVRHRPRLAGRSTGGDPTVALRALKDLLALRVRLLRSEARGLGSRGDGPCA